MVLRGVNCHSAFAHYEMFHHCHGEGSLNSVFNYNTTYNIGSGVGVGIGGNFWTGLGYGIGNWFANLIGGGMFSGGGMFGGGMDFLNPANYLTAWYGAGGGGAASGSRSSNNDSCHCSHCDGNNGDKGKVVEDKDNAKLKEYKGEFNKLGDKPTDKQVKDLYNKVMNSYKNPADEYNNELNDAYKLLLQDIRRNYPNVVLPKDEISEGLKKDDTDNETIEDYDAKVAKLKGLREADPDYEFTDAELADAREIYANCAEWSIEPQDELFGTQNKNAYENLMHKLEELFGKDALTKPASTALTPTGIEGAGDPQAIQAADGAEDAAAAKEAAVAKANEAAAKARNAAEEAAQDAQDAADAAAEKPGNAEAKAAAEEAAEAAMKAAEEAEKAEKAAQDAEKAEDADAAQAAADEAEAAAKAAQDAAKAAKEAAEKAKKAVQANEDEAEVEDTELLRPIGSDVVAKPHLTPAKEGKNGEVGEDIYDVSFDRLDSSEILAILNKLDLIREIKGTTSEIKVEDVKEKRVDTSNNKIEASVTVRSEDAKRIYTYTFIESENGQVFFHGNSDKQVYVLQYDKNSGQYQLNQYKGYSGHKKGDTIHESER